jgi:hypothetical protein
MYMTSQIWKDTSAVPLRSSTVDFVQYGTEVSDIREPLSSTCVHGFPV